MRKERYVPSSQTREQIKEDVNCTVAAETAVGSRAAMLACNDITLNNVYTHSANQRHERYRDCPEWFIFLQTI